MQRTRHLCFDSFKAARGALEPLFSPFRSDEHLRREVRLYLIPSLSLRRHRPASDRLGQAQERSLFRTNVSLVLQEARRRANHRVAAVALDIALAEARPGHLAQELDPAWVKDAVASCQAVEELRLMESVLRKHEEQLLASGTAAGTEGFLLTAAFGRSAAVMERGRRLGDDDDDGVATSAGLAATSLGSTTEGNAGKGLTVTQPPPPQQQLPPQQQQIAAALAQPPSGTDLATCGGGVDESLWSSQDARAAAGLRRLQRQHRDVTAGPNVSFTRYFLHQGLVRNETELMALYQAMRARPHDVAFRVLGAASGNSSTGGKDDVHICSQYAEAVQALVQRRRGLHRVPWLPLSMGAYTLDTRESVPHDVVLSNRHLVRSLARERLVVYQSLSSMLPVLFLDPQPGEALLDLCASPGNKTGLILDAIHGARVSGTAPGSVTGCVVANEAQSSRLRDLQERLRDASPEVAVTRGCGQAFGPAASGLDAQESLGDEGLYDGVLVDAPCSGEGRMGRDAMSWRLWHPGRGLEFFPTQVALLRRAVRLCKMGGRVVYATCTLNPLENEAVVAAVLRECGGAVELVAPPPLHSFATAAAAAAAARGQPSNIGEGEVPALRLSPGLARWDVPSSAGGFLRSAAEAYAQGESQRRLLPDMFAADESDRVGEVGAALHRCCRRVMPHLNGNTDGFFVAMLRKTATVRVPHRELSRASTVLPTSVRSVARTAAAASLAVSLAGGRTLLNDGGFLRLQATNPAVQCRLGPFFGAAPSPSASRTALLASQRGCLTVQSFLERSGWTALWREGEGLRLLSTAAVQLLQRHTTTATAESSNDTALCVPKGSSSELLEAGVLVVDAQGSLTERGASLLHGSATRRVLTLPLPYAQLLLSNRTLEVGGSLQLMPAFMQEAELALNPQKGLLRPLGGSSIAGSAPATPQWCLSALEALQDGAPGNAIVRIDVPSSSSSAAVSGGDSAWAAPLAQWSWPVRVEVLRPWSAAAGVTSGLARLHLTLPPSSRNRTLALIGRLQGHAHRLRSAPVRQREQLRASASLTPSLVMGSRELYGVPPQPHQQHRQLFHGGGGEHEARSAPAAKEPVGGSAAATATSPSAASTVFEL